MATSNSSKPDENAEPSDSASEPDSPDSGDARAAPLRIKTAPLAAAGQYCELIARMLAGSRQSPAKTRDMRERVQAAANDPAKDPNDLEPIRRAFDPPIFPSANWLDRAWEIAAELLPIDPRAFQFLAQSGCPLCIESAFFPFQNVWNAAADGTIGAKVASCLAESKIFGGREFGAHAIGLWALSQRNDLHEFCSKNSNAARLLRLTANVVDLSLRSPANREPLMRNIARAAARMRPDNAPALLASIDRERAKCQTRRYNAHPVPAFVPYSDWLPEIAGHILGELYWPEHPPTETAIPALRAILDAASSSGKNIELSDTLLYCRFGLGRAHDLYQNGTPGGHDACARLENGLATLFPNANPADLAQAAFDNGAKNILSHREGQAIASAAADAHAIDNAGSTNATSPTSAKPRL